jgi:hypothetical protein
MIQQYLHTPILLHGVVFKLRIRATLSFTVTSHKFLPGLGLGEYTVPWSKTSCFAPFALGYNAVQFVENQPMFWRSMIAPSSGLKNKPSKKQIAYSLTLKMEVTHSSETSVDFQWSTWCYVSEK